VNENAPDDVIAVLTHDHREVQEFFDELRGLARRLRNRRRRGRRCPTPLVRTLVTGASAMNDESCVPPAAADPAPPPRR
jgi:hypothetical protein